MIFMITGKPRGGKSLRAVQLLAEDRVLTLADGDLVARYADTWVWRRRCREFNTFTAGAVGRMSLTG